MTAPDPADVELIAEALSIDTRTDEGQQQWTAMCTRVICHLVLRDRGFAATLAVLGGVFAIMSALAAEYWRWRRWRYRKAMARVSADD